MALENGIERALMVHPSGVYGQFIRGGGNIDTKVAQGWLFLASDRNRLARVVDLYELINGKPVRVGEPVADYNTPEVTPEVVKRGPGRPKKNQQTN